MAIKSNSNLDYLNVKSINNWNTDETVILSTKIFKINKREKKQERIFLLTDKSIYNIKPSKDQTTIIKVKNNNILYQRCINLTNIVSLTISTLSSQFTINIPSEYDYRYQAFDITHRQEIITAIYNTCKIKHKIQLTVHKINQFSTALFTVKKKDDKFIASIKRKSISQQPTVRLSLSNKNDAIINDKIDKDNITQDNKNVKIKETKVTQHLKIPTAADDIKVDIIAVPTFTNYVEIGTAKLQLKQCNNGEMKYESCTSKIHHIQTETTPMEASKYYDLLIHGYMRDIEKKLKLIPDDIKTLCIRFYYKFLMYNEYCDVQFKKEFDAPKLLIQPAVLIACDKIQFGCRLVSRLPINIMDNICKVSIKIIELFNMNQLEDEEFECIAINDYYASVTDELDLVKDDKYTIMQTSPSGWWYAVNGDGEDGWVPSNYLERIKDDSYGKIIIGVTTNPESFMNAPINE
eukprot:345762_1